MPPEAERLLQEIRRHGNPDDVDDPQSGLRLQYERGYLEVADLEEILRDRMKMEMLIKRGLFR